MSARLLMLSGAILSQAWAQDLHTCFSSGQVYTGTLLGTNASTQLWPNGGFVADISHCRQTCWTLASACEVISYQKTAGLSWGPGGCWLFGPGAEMKIADNVTAFASGPKICEGETEETTLAPVATATITTLAPVIIPVIAPVVTIEGNMTNTTTTEEVAGGGGFPWWGMLLIGLGVVVAGVLAYCCFCNKESAPKKSKKTKRSVKETPVDDVEASQERAVTQAMAAEATPLMMASAPEPISTVAMPMAQYTSVPMPQYTAASMPAYATPAYATALAAAPVVRTIGTYGAQGAQQPQMIYTEQPQMFYAEQPQMVFAQEPQYSHQPQMVYGEQPPMVYTQQPQMFISGAQHPFYG